MSKYNFTNINKPRRMSSREYDGFHYTNRYLIFSKGTKADFGDNVSLSIDQDNKAVCIKMGGDYKITKIQGRNSISAPHLKSLLAKGRYIALDTDYDGGAIYVLGEGKL